MIVKDEFADLEQIRLKYLEDKIIDALIEFDKDKEMQWISIRFERVLLEILLKAVEKQINAGWISVKVRLPNEDGYYLTTWKGYHSIEPVTRFHRFSCGRFELDGIIAWQPLPKPYKE